MHHDQLSAMSPFLDRLSARSILNDDERQAILDLPGTGSEVGTNRDFVHLDEVVGHATFVAAGLVGRFAQTCEGRRQITALYIAGDMSDLQSVVLPQACSALQALTKTSIIRVSHQALRKAAARYPAIAEAFWRHCTVDSVIAAQWVLNVGRRDAATRIAHLICEMASRYHSATDQKAFAFAFPITQSQLADASGLTPVHVNRTLQSMRRAEVLRFDRGKVSVLDWPLLVAMADFEKRYLQLDAQPERLAA